MNNANIFRDFYVLSEKWYEMVRKIRQRLATIIFFLRSTIIDNYQQLFLGGHQLSTITNNCFEVVND